MITDHWGGCPLVLRCFSGGTSQSFSHHLYNQQIICVLFVFLSGFPEISPRPQCSFFTFSDMVAGARAAVLAQRSVQLSSYQQKFPPGSCTKNVKKHLKFRGDSGRR